MARRRKGRAINGWIAVDKPEGLSSTQVLSRVRHIVDAAKAGHGGTLDPMATGVLPIAFGEATKTVEYAMGGRKTYRFTVRWGEGRDTDDALGHVTGVDGYRPLDAEIAAALPEFTGTIWQQPPQFSAIWIAGERAYDMARAGRPVEIAARQITVNLLTQIDRPDSDHSVFEVTCGRGTYVRSLARDLGRRLGTLAHVTTLRRLSVGRFTLQNALSLEQLIEAVQSDTFPQLLCGLETVLDDIPALAISQAQAQRLRQGQVVLWAAPPRDGWSSAVPEISTTSAPVTVLALLDGLPVALARAESGGIRSLRVLNL